MKFIVSVDQTPDGQWVADCPTVPGCTSRGATKAEAMINVEEAIERIVRERSGPEMPLTLDVREQEKDDWKPPKS